MTAARQTLAGVIEGFYGRPWSMADRHAYGPLLVDLGLNSYLYCPKADPYLRRDWQRHWPAPQWRALRALAADYAQRGLLFGVGLSPFALYQRYGATERARLRDKVRRLQELDAGLLALLFDDMPGALPDLAQRQAEIAADVQHWAEGQRLLVCPTYYSLDPALEMHFGARPVDYWPDLGRQLAPEIGVFWTGNLVCAESISGADLKPLREALQRPLTLWDNYPVNDGAKRSQHLYCSPLAARNGDIAGYIEGHFCNPMNQAWLSLPALRGLAARYGKTPAADWEATVLGSATWAALCRDRAAFAERGLAGMGPGECRRLAAEYAALPGPAAAEVAGWLRGEYAFDPACLTD